MHSPSDVAAAVTAANQILLSSSSSSLGFDSPILPPAYSVALLYEVPTYYHQYVALGLP